MPARLVLVLLAAAALAGCTDAASQGTGGPPGQIDGAVIDQYMQPYANASVHLVELDRWDNSSELGGFTFRQVPPGTYTLRVQPESADADTERIEVRPGDVSRIILQPSREIPPSPHLAALAKEGRAAVALPNTECKECAWSTHLYASPEEVVLHAYWDDAVGANLIVRVYDSSGQLLVEAMDDDGEIWAPIEGHRIVQQDPRLHVRVHFGPDLLPQKDYEVRTVLDVYYHADRSAQEA